jgi:pimeloyl-ACP methyl ester carboxylesterase
MHLATFARAVRVLAIAPCMLAGGCALVQLHQENVAYSAATVLAGRVLEPRAWRGPVSVAAIREVDGKAVVAHEVWLHEPSGFELIVPDGDYTLVAYADGDNDGRPDVAGPAGVRVGNVHVAGAGLISMLDIAPQEGGAQSVMAALPTNYHRAARPSSAAGALANLGLPQFSAETGKRGYWAPVEFFRTFGGNVYFVEPYDPGRTPVLFIHGATGSAQDWRYFVAHLDRTRYQPWIFQYPSGAPLEAMANLLYWKILNLQVRYGFSRLEVVAHSMGGLVARRFLLDHAAEFPQLDQFVSISTPWGGQASAARGVSHSPAVIPSWRDMQPEGPYLKALFEKPLPPGVTHTLLFGHHGGSGLLREPSDGTIVVASQLRREAQDGASLVMGFDEDHVSILSSPKVVSEVERVFAGSADASLAGRLMLSIGVSPATESATGISTLVLRRIDGAHSDRDEDLMLAIADVGAPTTLGPLAAGEYEARLAMAPFRAVPDRQRVRLEPGGVAQLRFDLRPDGVMIGEVVAQSDRVHRPAGSYQRAENAIQADSITLVGATITRELTARPGPRGSLLEAYLDGRDDAANQAFCFLGLPAGDYQLTIRAKGFETYTSRYTIVPGRYAPLPPVVLRRAASTPR